MHGNPTTPSGSHATLAFLKHVLPDEGFYAAFWAERKQHFFTSSICKLADWIIARDSQGQTVYHACASFADAEGGRKASNTKSSKAFWQDIDSKLTHANAHYADPQEAAEAALEFCHKARLPPPLFVGSGGGINTYWPLGADLEPAEWLAYARALKSLVHEKGLVADPSRTSDLASILRTPGTHNRKGGAERLVQCGDLVGPYAIEQFEMLGGKKIFSVSGVSENRLRNRKSGIRQVGSLAGAVTQTYDGPKSEADLIADRCAQLRRFRDTRGNLDEPHWHAGIGLLLRCKDGEKKIHDWLSGYRTTRSKKRKATSKGRGKSQARQHANVSTRSAPRRARRVRIGTKSRALSVLVKP
jgi:hypothetical protein